MSDPRRPTGPDPNQPQWSQPTQPPGHQYPPVDPAYSGHYSYPGYTPSATPHPTEPLPPYWTQTQYHTPPPQPEPPPPGPPKTPRWLWLIAGAAVLLVIGLVVTLVIVNGSQRQDTVVAPLPPMSGDAATTTRTPSPLPTTTRTPAPTTTRVPGPTTPSLPDTSTGTTETTEPTDSAATETVVYSVDGQGRAISITYVDTGGVLQMEFNVVLPWSREVALSPSTASAASVTVINVGRDITCSVSVNGTPGQKCTGSGLTICASPG